MRAALCLAMTGTTFDSNDQSAAWTHQGLLAGETGIRGRWRHDRPKHAHAAKGFCRSSGLGDRMGTAGRGWQSCWMPPASGRRVAAAGIPTSFAGCGQNGCAASCACCCRASRGIFAATKCQDSRAARVRHRCFTRRVHGTTWAPSAAGKSHTRLGKVTQRALSEPSGWIP